MRVTLHAKLASADLQQYPLSDKECGNRALPSLYGRLLEITRKVRLSLTEEFVLFYLFFILKSLTEFYLSPIELYYLFGGNKYIQGYPGYRMRHQ